MLCHSCRVHVRRDFPYCLYCGTLRRGAAPTSYAAPHLRGVDDPTLLVPLTGPVTTLGRGADSDVVLPDSSVSRRHARIVRTESGFRIEDLDSFNGTAVAGVDLHGGAAHLADGTELSIGDVRLVFEQPRGAHIGQRTQVVGTQLTQLPTAVQEAAPEANGPLTARPRRRSGWALKQVPTDRGEPRWVLNNTRTGVYLELDEREVFLWHAVDGENTVRDLLFAYADRFGELALPRIEAALAAFANAGLLRGLPGRTEDTGRKGWRRAGRAVYRALLKLEISVPGLDRVVTRLYHAFGWRFFTRTGVTLVWLSVIGGLAAFFAAQGRQHLLDFGGAGAWGPVLLAAGYVSALVVHELTHALAVKSYGRKVRRGGFLLMMGMPFAFVDTSDMWFGTRWSRVVVALSGPLSTAALAAGARRRGRPARRTGLGRPLPPGLRPLPEHALQLQPPDAAGRLPGPDRRAARAAAARGGERVLPQGALAGPARRPPARPTAGGHGRVRPRGRRRHVRLPRPRPAGLALPDRRPAGRVAVPAVDHGDRGGRGRPGGFPRVVRAGAVADAPCAPPP